MILQTTGGFTSSVFTGDLFPLGPWCTSGDSRPLSIADTLGEDCSQGTDSESVRVIEAIEDVLYPSLSKLHQIDLPNSFWRESLGIYLRMLVPLMLRRRDLLIHARDCHGHSQFTQADVDLESIIPKSRQGLLAVVNSHAWNHFVFGELSKTIGLAPIAPSSSLVLHGPTQVEPRHSLSHHPSLHKQFALRALNALAKRSPVIISRTMLPKRHEVWLALRNLSLPFTWTEDDVPGQPINLDVRSHLSKMVQSQDAIESTVIALCVLLIPRIFIEDFMNAWREGEKRLQRFPQVVFTSNLHLASDVFLIWLARAHAHGTKIVIAQHGGVHSLCKEIPGDLQAERDLADTYITWGFPTFRSSTALQGPTLVNVGVKKRRKCEVSDGSLLVVLDSTYRYPSVPRGMNGSRFEYASFVNQFLENIDPNRVPRVVIRGYMGAEIYDDPLFPLIHKRDSFTIDDGKCSIQKLFDASRFVIQTSLGTTAFQSFHQQIPTSILLNGELSPLSDASAKEFVGLRNAKIYFDNPSDLAGHVNEVFPNSYQWWKSSAVQESIKQFESIMSPVSARPIRFYNQTIRHSTRDLRGFN